MYPYPVKENSNAAGPSLGPARKEKDNDPGPSNRVNWPNGPAGVFTQGIYFELLLRIISYSKIFILGLKNLEREELDLPMITSESVPGTGRNIS